MCSPRLHMPAERCYDKTLSCKTEPVRRTDGMPIPLAIRRPAPRQREGSLLRDLNRFSRNPRLPKQSWVFCFNQALPREAGIEKKNDNDNHRNQVRTGNAVRSDSNTGRPFSGLSRDGARELEGKVAPAG